MTEAGGGVIAEPRGRAGFLGTVFGVVWRPKRFFADWPELPTRTSPLPFAIGVGALSHAGLGNQAGWAKEPLTIAGQVASSLALGALLAVPQLYVASAIVHAFVRAFGGRARMRDSRRALAYAAAPLVMSGIPWLGNWLGIAFQVWYWAVAVVALATVHSIGRFRAALAFVGPVVLAVALAVGLRAYVVEAFKIPSGSMYPTLLVGDHLFVLKSAYGVFRKSAPERGDVVVFEAPEEEDGQSADYVKRVVGIPGDLITVDAGHLRINERAVPTCRVGVVERRPSEIDPDGLPGELFVEFLGRSPYLVFLEQGRFTRTEGPFTVAAGETFVVGDNRMNSRDSRSFFSGRGGGVPFASIKGRAGVIWLPFPRFWQPVHAPVLPEPADPALKEALARCLANPPR